jgi:hypothetical protein
VPEMPAIATDSYTHGMQIGLGVLLLVAIIGYWSFLRRQGRRAARAWPIARGRNMGRAPPPAGGAAVASAPSVSCTAPKVTQPLRVGFRSGFFRRGTERSTVRVSDRRRCPGSTW